ncbi:MAG: perosamine synthetase [Mariniblastus sp.]|jgi:perosamine synthetase
MWARKRIDLRFRDLAMAFLKCLRPGSRIDSEWAISESFGSRDAMVCLSVRTGFDMLLNALDLPAGSEVIFTGLTIGDMPKIAIENGLRPVGVDLDSRTLAPDLLDLESAITHETRVIVVAHLLGGRCTMDEIADLARSRGLLLIEDCAQAFVGLQYRGSPQADVSMFSFGSIKTHTALGGAVLIVRDSRIRSQMEALQQRYPILSAGSFAKRVVKYAGVKLISTWIVAAFVRLFFRCLGTHHDKTASKMAKGFAGPDFFNRIRKRPSSAMLAFLAKRLSQFTPATIDVRVKRASRLLATLGAADDWLAPVGLQAVSPTHWVFPITVSNAQELVECLWQNGFDATTRSSLTSVNEITCKSNASYNASLQSGGDLPNVEFILKHAVFLPLDAPIPDREIDRLARLVIEHAKPIQGAPVKSQAAAARMTIPAFSRSK